jgi:hypothetical protein
MRRYRVIPEIRRGLGRHAVDHGEPRLDAGAVTGIGLSGQRCREYHPPALLQADEAVAPGGLIGTEIASGDRDETSTFGEARSAELI